MSTKISWTKPKINRARFLQIWIITSTVVPTLLDFFFFGSSLARYSRVLLFLAVSASFMINQKYFITGQLNGLGTIFLTFLLYLVGTIAGLTRGGTITPNIASLLLIMLIVGLNTDLHEVSVKSLIYSCNLLVIISVIVIVLKLNPRNFYLSSQGYPVYFNILGIPGRNYGVFSHPNVLGQAAAFSAIGILVSQKNLFLLVAPLFCLLKCGSRTSIFGFAVSALVYFLMLIFRSRRIARIRKIESRLVVGTFLLGVLIALSIQFMNYIRFINPDSLTGRASIWQASLEIFKNAPFLGLGWDWERTAVDSQLINVWSVTSHNLLLEILFSSGFLGLIIFLSILVKVIVNLSLLSDFEKITLILLLISGISESIINLQYPTIQTAFFFLIALYSHMDRRI